MIWKHIFSTLITVLLATSGVIAQDGTSTKGDPSVTPWNDPDDPYVIRLNKDDPSTTSWNYRNSRLAKDRKGPTDLNRYGGGARHEAFPTFMGAPVALTPQELKDGGIDVAIVGALTDMNAVPGTILGANMLRAAAISSADYFTAKGDGKQEANPDVFPVDCAPQILCARSRGLRFETVLMVKSTQHGTGDHLQSNENGVSVKFWTHRQVRRWFRNPWSDRHVRAPAVVMHAPQLEQLSKMILGDRYHPVERLAA